MSTVDEVFNAAQSLTLPEQRQLVERLRSSIPLEFDDSTIAELDRRFAEYEAGEVEAIPGDEVRRLLHSWVNRHG